MHIDAQRSEHRKNQDKDNLDDGHELCRQTKVYDLPSGVIHLVTKPAMASEQER